MKTYPYTHQHLSPFHLALSSGPIAPDDTIFHSSQSGLRIYGWQLIELLSDTGKIMICTDVVDAWLELLVNYANRNACNILAMRTKHDSERTDAESENGGGQTEIGKGEKLYHVLPIPVSDAIFRTPTPTTHFSASTYLHQHSLSPHQLLSAHIILVPLDIPIGGMAGHSILVAIFPQRRIFSLHDSWRPKRRLRARKIVRELVWFLEGYLGTLWEPGAWKVNVARGPWQRNRVDCGIWVCVHSWDVVMGLEEEGVGLMNASLQKGYNIKEMRRRMFVDILRGGLSDEEMETPVLGLKNQVEDVTDSGSFAESTPLKFIKKKIWRSACPLIPFRDLRQIVIRARKMLLSEALHHTRG